MQNCQEKGVAGGRVLRVFPESWRKGTEAVKPARSGREPGSSCLRPGFPNWMKSCSSSSSSSRRSTSSSSSSGGSSSSSSRRRRKRTRRTGGKEERRRYPERSSHPNQRGSGRREVGGLAGRDPEAVPTGGRGGRKADGRLQSAGNWEAQVK
ncbi:transmembrane protein 40-like [Rousettus aegyptiacus]|uniref:transmembrane protein 40-like n=1 Tax=Rousettus aegyptiacus TaxID=9407 RepID=UPI00168D0D9B|nr:transmembrane protein 40-like [Rousettus aegyptiacus]